MRARSQGNACLTASRSGGSGSRSEEGDFRLMCCAGRMNMTGAGSCTKRICRRTRRTWFHGVSLPPSSFVLVRHLRVASRPPFYVVISTTPFPPPKLGTVWLYSRPAGAVWRLVKTGIGSLNPNIASQPNLSRMSRYVILRFLRSRRGSRCDNIGSLRHVLAAR